MSERDSNNPTPAENFVPADLAPYQVYLTEHAKASVDAVTFEERNAEGSSAIADVASSMAVHSLNQPGASVEIPALIQTFHAAVREAGEAFREAFDADGQKRPDQELAYKGAMKQLRPIGRRYMVDAFAEAGIPLTSPDAFFGSLSFADAIALAARNVGQVEALHAESAQELLTDEAVKSTLQRLFASDEQFAKNIPTLRVGNVNEEDPSVQRGLDLAVRIQNATWAIGNVHKAAWEGTDKRIDPNQTAEFNPYDLFLRTAYQLAYDQALQSRVNNETAAVEALIATAFHIWKDVQPSSERVRSEDRLVPMTYPLDTQLAVHVKARTEVAAGYPSRAPAPDTWDDISSYAPESYTDSRVLERDRTKAPGYPDSYDSKYSWADPEDVSQVDHDFESYEGTVRFDEQGHPLNPLGPTGIRGRGLLGNWGANNAADPMVTRINGGKLELLVIQRDNGEWALPGGMVDRGERITATLKRELGEETAAELDFEHAQPVYQGYVDDPRNTDNAWMETDAYHLHLDGDAALVLEAGDDAKAVRWMVLDGPDVDNLYASHSDLVKRMVAQWQAQTGQVVRRDGKVGVAA